MTWKVTNRFLLVCVILCAFQLNAQAITANIAPQASSTSTHEFDTIRNYQTEKQIREDYKRFEERKKQEQDQNIKEPEKKKKIKVKKATKEEYATKGVYVEKIEVSPSQILTEKEIKNIIDDYTQTNLTIEQLQEIVTKINTLYLKKGFVTARAYLPEQEVENETIKIMLLEGKVGTVNIKGNKWTRTSYIKKRIRQEEGQLFNIQTLENNIVNFNRYNEGVALTGSLEAGKEKLGTTDITLNAQEKSPFHITALMDNTGRQTTGEYRGGLMLQDDSLFGIRDKLTLGAFANKNLVTPFVDYNVPVNKNDDRVGFSFSSSYSKISNGPYQLFNIESRSQNYSLYYTHPFIRKPWTELSSTVSLNYKHSTTSFDDVEIFKNEIASAQAGLNWRYDTAKGIWYLNQNVSYAFPLFDEDSNYLKLDGGLLRLHDFGHGFVGTLKANYQVIPNRDVVPYADQFLAGGAMTVRGYSEGILIGKNGYLVSMEMLFPLAPRYIQNKEKTKQYPFLGNYVKGFAFVDHAGVFPYKGTGEGSEGYNINDFLLSVGVGLRITLPKDIMIKLSWGIPIIRNNHEETTQNARFHFELCIAPDIDAILKLRRPKHTEPL